MVAGGALDSKLLVWRIWVSLIWVSLIWVSLIWVSLVWVFPNQRTIFTLAVL
jgi:hypothetical protein